MAVQAGLWHHCSFLKIFKADFHDDPLMIFSEQWFLTFHVVAERDLETAFASRFKLLQVHFKRPSMIFM